MTLGGNLQTHQVNQVFEYNTIYMTNGNPYYFHPYPWPTEDFNDPENVVFRNNIIYDLRSNYDQEHTTIYINAYLTNELYLLSVPALRFNNNLYYNPNRPVRFGFAWDTSWGNLGGEFTFSEWQAEYGYDMDSTVNDPNFIQIETQNLFRYNPTSNLFRPADPAIADRMGAYAGQNTNTAPSVFTSLEQKANPGDMLSFHIAVTDVNEGDSVSLSSHPLPDGASLTRVFRRIWRFSWQTDNSDKGIHSLVFTANDGSIDSDSVSVSITVGKKIIAPVRSLRILRLS